MKEIEVVDDEGMSKKIEPKGILHWVVGAIAVCFSLYHLYTSYFGVLPALQHRAIHLTFTLVLLFLLFPCHRSRRRAQRDTLRDLACRDQAPESNEQLTGQRHDHRLARAAASVGRSQIKPFCQGAILLEPDKTPGQLDHATPDAGRRPAASRPS